NPDDGKEAPEPLAKEIHAFFQSAMKDTKALGIKGFWGHTTKESQRVIAGGLLYKLNYFRHMAILSKDPPKDFKEFMIELAKVDTRAVDDLFARYGINPKTIPTTLDRLEPREDHLRKTARSADSIVSLPQFIDEAVGVSKAITAGLDEVERIQPYLIKAVRTDN